MMQTQPVKLYNIASTKFYTICVMNPLNDALYLHGAKVSVVINSLRPLRPLRPLVSLLSMGQARIPFVLFPPIKLGDCF